jgi:hypothetical protein
VRASPPALAALCARPGIDWPRVAAVARLHRVGALLLDALQRGGAVAAGQVPAEVVAALRRQRRLEVAQATRLDEALSMLLPAFSAAGVPVIVLKGVTLARLYPSPSCRPRTDIDLLVEPAHLPTADRVLTRLGYRLLEAGHVQRPLLSPVQAPEDRQYERAKDHTLVELHADFLHTGLRRRADSAVWRRRQLVEVGGRLVPALAPGDAFLQAAAHLQRHGYLQLLWFYDIVMLLRADGAQIDWTALARQAEDAGVTTAAYFAISYAEAFFGPLVPPLARRALRPNALRRRLHEATWSRRLIISLEGDDSEWRAALERGDELRPWHFDAYAPPDKILAHLLLSGNVWPKLCCLGRRLLPTEEWLRYYGPRRVRNYYLRLWLTRLLARVTRLFTTFSPETAP